MKNILADLRFAVRTLSRTPVFTAVCIASLALGIGANTAIFTLMDQALMRKLPVKDPDRLVIVTSPGPKRGFHVADDNGNSSFSYPMYKDLRDRNQVFDGLLGRYGTGAAVGYRGTTERAQAELVTGNYFDVLGVSPLIGRTLTPSDDEKPDAHPVVVLSHGFWQRRFGGDSSVLNRQIVVNGESMTVVGITRPEFFGVQPGLAPDFFVPMAMKRRLTPTWYHLDDRKSYWLVVMGRLKPGMTAQAAAAQLNTVYKPLLVEELKAFRDATKNFAEKFTAKQIILEPGALGRANLRTQFREPLLMLIGITGFVLLIACANVASLLVAKATARTREIAIRLSLGASRGALFRQLLAESLVLSLSGGLLAILVAIWTTDGILYMLPDDGSGPTALSSTLNGRILLFHLGLSLATGILFGMAPALQSTRSNVAPALKEQGNSVSGSGGTVQLRRLLVAAQVSVSLLLLVGAGLFARTVYNLSSVDAGFNASQVIQFQVNASLLGHPADRVHDIYRRIGEKLSAIPGIQSVSAAQEPLMNSSIMSSTIRVPGYQHKENEDMNPWLNYITPGYFTTLGVPLIGGRDFTTADGLKSPKVAIVNETFARYFFGKESALGRKLVFGRDSKAEIEIVGVVKDMKHGGLRDQPTRFVYTPYAQVEGPSGMTFHLRTALSEAAVANLLRRSIREIDPNLPVVDLRTLEYQMRQSIGNERMIAILSASFALLATLLAAIGLYGVMAYSVARRTREIGIRIALGALHGRVVWLVMREVMALLAVGVVVGLPSAYLLGKYAESQLFGMKSHDAVVMIAAVVCLGAVAALAGFVPARRATRIDPLKALRYE